MSGSHNSSNVIKALIEAGNDLLLCAAKLNGNGHGGFERELMAIAKALHDRADALIKLRKAAATTDEEQAMIVSAFTNVS